MVDAIDGFGGSARVVETRDSKYSRYKVCMDEGPQPAFWAHDFEVTVLMDSRVATYEHIQQVQRRIYAVIANLLRRAQEHDQSKLVSPEVEAFDEFTPKLAGMTYGSDEYKACLAAMKPALDHHYAANAGHHPEGNPDGIRGMSLLDLTEMVLDWDAASKRHNDGSILRSIEINQKRFGYSDELKQTLLNTVAELGLAAP